MTKFKSLVLIIWLANDCYSAYEDRPKIRTIDGDLILEAAVNKNIYLRTNGPKSTVFVGDVSLLNVTGSRNEDYPQTAVSQHLDLDGILSRLDKLEAITPYDSIDLARNISMLFRRLSRQRMEISRLRNQFNNWRKNECLSRPCQNGGTCLNLPNGFFCLCPSNWEGESCDVDVNECRNFVDTDLGCQNGGKCINKPGSYECQCKNNWIGVHCTATSKNCSASDYETCGHGTCLNSPHTGNGIVCICNQGWTKVAIDAPCITDVDECESSQGPRCSVNPKVDCVNLPGSFRCGQCPPGYEGDGYSCSDVDECLTVKPNGGCSPMATCHNTVGSRICGPCPYNYQGDGITCTYTGSCNNNHGGCHPSARCIEGLGGQITQCICPPGMEGDGIGLQGCYIASASNENRTCEDVPCVHGACHSLRNGYTCICNRGYSGATCNAAADYCASSPCLHGGTCKRDESTVRGFRCECTAQYTGDLCHVEIKTCGRLLQAEEGSISFPQNNSTNYINNAKCAWVIQTAHDKVVNVTFSKFSLESSPECLYDFLQIHDGRSPASHMIGRFCGNTLPNGGNIVSSHNKLYLWFRSDNSVAKDGFSLHWVSSVPVCGGEVDASAHGVISSPGSPGNYPPNRDCYWHLTTNFGKRIQLHFYALDIEEHQNCSFDYISIYDGPSASDSLLGMYCNSTLPAPIQSASSELMIHFHSDQYNTGKGFQISFAPTEGVPGCGGLYTAANGEINSPSYNGKYLSNLYCEYKIKLGLDYKIRLNFKSFQLEPSIRCTYDFLKVYDGPSSDSGLVGRFCGSAYPKSYTSSSNTLFIVFKTDNSVGRGGFKLTYETVCQQTIVGESGVIKSIGYPFTYPYNQICEYVIITTPGKAIQLDFQDFDIENTTYCSFDYLLIKDGPDINSTTLEKFCGKRIPPTQTSTHNYMYLRLVSDRSITGAGFYANYTSVDTECGGIHRNRTGMINHPEVEEDKYKNDQSCTWMIIAPEGKKIRITWNRFRLENYCATDYVELIELDENNKNYTMGKYCGSSIPPTMVVASNRALLKFKSDSSLTYGGFSMSYSILDTHCGATYSRPYGVIYSPGWPDRYPNNLECIWIIMAPHGQQIKLNITDFDLERQIRDRCTFGDYLDIRNGKTENSPRIGQYCADLIPRIITSTGNSLYIKFKSDSYISRKGFRLEWDSTVIGCGGVLTSPTGSISSPNYPLNYNDNSECFYSIISSAGSLIRITFKDIDLEDTFNCQDDYVEIFDGPNQNANSLGHYCTDAQNLVLNTTSNTAFIKFRSDVLYGGKGFLLEYITICQNNLSGFHGVIESPGYPEKYPGLNCLWRINVPKGNKINVTIVNFDAVTNHFNFYYSRRIPCGRAEYLQIKESTVLGNNTLINLCSYDHENRKLTSTENSLQIIFVTMVNVRSIAFRLEWAQYGCSRVIQKAYGSIALDKQFVSSAELECEWLIETPPGTKVTLYTREMNVKDSNNCTIDAVEIYNGPTTDTPLLTKFCHKAATHVKSTTNFMLVKLIKRSSLKDLTFNAYFMSYETGCGNVIESSSGVISSEHYPKNYDDNLDCMWTLIVPYHHRVELKFQDFDLYLDDDDPDNCGDHIKIYDGQYILNTNYSRIICPNDVVDKIISTNHMMGVQFITDVYGGAKGFKANFTVTCGSIIDAKYDGVITNDKIFSHYDINCTWSIRAPSLDDKITLTLTHMSIPRDLTIITNRRCPSSFIRLYDGDDETAPLIDEYCGSKVPPTVVSHGSALTLQFGSYSPIVIGTFSAHYTTLNNYCGGTLTSEEGSLASPNYPLSYPPDVDCEWTLSTSPGNRLYITFEKLDLDNSEECNEDYLEIRENYSSGKLLGVYCGNEIPINTTVASKLYIKFHSDSKTSGRGFLLHYGFLHGNEITDSESGEIASPLFPYAYDKSGDYTWRVTTSEKTTITVNVDHIEIPTDGDTCSNSLVIYDGYDTEASILDEYCGISIMEQKVLHTISNVVFIKLTLDDSNTGALFHMTWSRSNAIDKENQKSKINCGFNESQEIMPGQTITINSPNYPNTYDMNSNCEWIFKATVGHHIRVNFEDLRLEQMPGCYADSISLYSAENQGEWTVIKENICLDEFAQKETIASSNLKVTFKSDASLSLRGFRAKVSSVCGGVLSEPSGVVEPVRGDLSYFINNRKDMKCDWIVKVRAGRNIRFSFEHFNITNAQDLCNTYVILRNGASNESPMLGNGKICSQLEARELQESATNTMFVSYSTMRLGLFKTFRLRYEETNFECGVTSKLDELHTWENVSTPNYPRIPASYPECTWVFTGPPGKNLRIDFIESFNLLDSDDCSTEAVEIRDGLTDLSRSIGRFCGKSKPSTIKTTGNVVFIHYLSSMAEPMTGFKVNVSIDICGGTVRGEKGEFTSPGYPHFQALPYGTVCEWRIEGPKLQVLKMTINDIDLPVPEESCGTKLLIEETLKVNNSLVKLEEYCADGDIIWQKSNIFIETSTNEAIIKLVIGKTNSWDSTSDSRGFKLTYNTSRSTCGGVITTSEGYIATPGYPRETTLRYCQWVITVPNKDRRILLEIMDMDVPSHTIAIFNDANFKSTITTIAAANNIINNTTYESTGNKMSIYLWINKSVSRHRFKARFTSDEEALCGGSLSGVTGELSSPLINAYYNCEWNYHYNKGNLNNENITEYKSIYISGKMNITTASSMVSKVKCGFFNNPELTFNTGITRARAYVRKLCENTDIAVRIPTTALDIKASKSRNQRMDFNLNWKLQPCGGELQVTTEPVNIINIPDNYNDTVDCSWLISADYASRVEIKLEGEFQLDCADQFVEVSQGVSEYYNVIAEYCKDRAQAAPISTTAYKFMLVQYHLKAKNNNALKITVKAITNQCGGSFRQSNGVIHSPNYPKSYTSNSECTWDITVDVGKRIVLQFMGRFFIEKYPNCSKDAVIIYDWQEGDYSEIAKLCGRDLPPTFNSTQNKIKVVLRTDNNTSGDGFQVMWHSQCGGKYKATEKKQYIYSPGYPVRYSPHLDCNYTITTTSTQKIVVKFERFALEGTYPSCDNDKVTIYQNLGLEVFNENNLMNIYCGKEIPPLIGSFKEITFNFKTDSYIQDTGFKLSYQISECGGTVKEQTIISSGLLDYDNNLNCTWQIEAPANQNVILRFQYIDLETDCQSDYISVFNGLGILEENRLALLCGLINSTTVVKSRGNIMLLQFVTDAYKSYTGFKAQVIFTYSESVGCGGKIDLTTTSSYSLHSPFINSKVEYENYLDCIWSISAPVDYVIKVEFTSFHIAPCADVNQTLGIGDCQCDFVELKDGLNPTDFRIGAYCGHTNPPQLYSSSNSLAIRLVTDGDVTSSGFQATLSLQRSTCGQSVFKMSDKNQIIRSPGYENGAVPRGVHCMYHLDKSDSFPSETLRLTIKTLDIQPGVPHESQCNRDKLIIYADHLGRTNSSGKDYSYAGLRPYDWNSEYINDRKSPNRYTLCGKRESIDLYLYNSATIVLQTSADSNSKTYKGVEIETGLLSECGRNYTELQGRIKHDNLYSSTCTDCYTLITAPENYTISVYFLEISSYVMNGEYIDIYDGKDTKAKKLMQITQTNYMDISAFSTGRYLLLYDHYTRIYDEVTCYKKTYDMNFISTDKGQGCGGKLHNVKGRVTSPLYPAVYRKRSVCEFELETPQDTRLFLKFNVFDMGISCDKNYLELVDRSGKVVSTFCSEAPAEYTSDDNYVKIVFRTTQNNGGTGWVADFLAIA